VTRIEGCTALITGGASGIGFLIGKLLLEEGAARIVIWDVSDQALTPAIAELTTHGHHVDGFQVDVTHLAQVRGVLQEMLERGIRIDVLVNNAGVVVGKTFVDHLPEEIQRTIAVNALAPMQLTRELLPTMLERASGHIVNISSAAALVSNPGMSAYCASKWAVTGWSDSLRIELEQSKSGVRVTTVMPYYTNTGMFAGVRSRVIPILEPEYVAQQIVSAIRRNRILVHLPTWFRLVRLLQGLLPTRWFDTVAGEWFGIYHSMSTFTGRAR
jgi:all-trans-retinol dehydrogenase (NAD+)